jgi:hypothetical protein
MFEDGKWFCDTVSVIERSNGRTHKFYPSAWISDGEWVVSEKSGDVVV